MKIYTVVTHILGLQYKSPTETIKKIRDKTKNQKQYARKYLHHFSTPRYMFWSPRVPVGFLTTELKKIHGLEPVINEEYTQRVRDLEAKAAKATYNAGNPAFRLLQILGHLRE